MINPLQKILTHQKSMNALADKLFVSTPYISNCLRGGYVNPQKLAHKLEAAGMVDNSEEFLSEYRAWRKEKMDAAESNLPEESLNVAEESLEKPVSIADIPIEEHQEPFVESSDCNESKDSVYYAVSL